MAASAMAHRMVSIHPASPPTLRFQTVLASQTPQLLIPAISPRVVTPLSVRQTSSAVVRQQAALRRALLISGTRRPVRTLAAGSVPQFSAALRARGLF